MNSVLPIEHVRKMYKKSFNVTKQIKVAEKKNEYVLLKCRISLTSFKDFNFPRLKVKYPDFSLT